MIAPRRLLERARVVLAAQDIACRHTRPKKVEGILRVSDPDAPRAREILLAHFGEEAVVSASSAAWFRCLACRAPVSATDDYCPACGNPVGDFHGR